MNKMLGCNALKYKIIKKIANAALRCYAALLHSSTADEERSLPMII